MSNGESEFTIKDLLITGRSGFGFVDSDVPIMLSLLDPEQGRPQFVNLYFDPNGGARMSVGILECDGDRLRICFSQPGAPGETVYEDRRPPAFAVGSKVTRLECRRRKDAAQLTAPEQQIGLTVTLPLIVGRYSEKLLQSQVSYSGISLYAENVQATNEGKPVRATVVLAHNCRLDSFEPIQGSNGQLWAAKFHVFQGEQADRSHQELTQEKVTHLADQGAIFVLDHMRSDANNQKCSDAENRVEMSAAVPKILQIRLRCDRRMSINRASSVVMLFSLTTGRLPSCPCIPVGQ